MFLKAKICLCLSLNKKIIMGKTKKELEELEEIKRLKAETEALKKAYAELSFHHKCSQTVLEVADELFDLGLQEKYKEELAIAKEQKKKQDESKK